MLHNLFRDRGRGATLQCNAAESDRDFLDCFLYFKHSSIKRVGNELCMFHSLMATQVDYKTPAVYSSGPSVYRSKPSALNIWINVSFIRGKYTLSIDGRLFICFNMYFL
jgi:hypothetical protein